MTDSGSFRLPNIPALPTPASITYPAVNLPDLSPHKSKLNPAQWSYEKMMEYIKAFEEELDDEHEVGARLVSHGSTTTFHMIDMGYAGPEVICFYGIDNSGQKVQLIQHYTQLNVLLVALRKLEDKPRRIGFDLSSTE